VHETLGVDSPETIRKRIKKEGRCSYPGFGTFTLTKRKARKGRNPQTGETIKIKASKSIKFKPAPALKKTVVEGAWPPGHPIN